MDSSVGTAMTLSLHLGDIVCSLVDSSVGTAMSRSLHLVDIVAATQVDLNVDDYY